MNIDNVVQLLISMIVAYDNWGDKVGYTKEELDNLIQKYELTKQDWNELGTIVLYEEDYITREKFCEKMDLEYDDGDYWMLFKNFSDTGVVDTNEAQTLDGNDVFHSDYYDYEIDFSDFSKKTLEVIKDYLIRKELSIESYDGEILATEDNTKIEKYDILISGESLSEHIDDEELDDLKRNIQYGYADAHDQAEMSAVYKECKKEFEEGVGEFKWKNYKKGDGKDYEMLWVKVDWDRIMRAKEELENSYNYDGKIIYSTEEEAFGTMYFVLREFDIIKMNSINYQYIYSYADNDLIDECVRERILYE